MKNLVDKWRLMLAIVSDPKLTGADKAVAAHLLDFCIERDEAWPSYDTLAERTRQTGRNVIKCVARLVEAEYFAVVRSTGRGHANVYKPVYDRAERVNAQSPFSAQEMVNGETPFDAERVNARVVKGERAGIERVNASSPHTSNDSSNEHKKEGKGLAVEPPVSLFPITGGKVIDTVVTTKRDKRPYLAKHGCTIDRYQPDPVSMGAWAAEKAPLVENPVAPETVDDIKDVWRRRGETPKDFDATYRTYLRKRNGWAAEKATATRTPSADEDTDRLYRSWGVS